MKYEDIEKVKLSLERPDFEKRVADSKKKCVYCDRDIKTGDDVLLIPLKCRYLCHECSTNTSVLLDISNQLSEIREKKRKEIENCIKRHNAETKQKVSKPDTNEVSTTRQQILDRCKELFSPYRKYSSKVINSEVDRLVADEKTEQGILFAINWWYAKPESNPELANGKLSIIDFVYADAMKAFHMKKEVMNSLKNATEPRTINVTVRTNRSKPRTDLFNLD